MTSKKGKDLLSRIYTRVTSNLMTKQVQASLEGKLTKQQIKSELNKLAQKHNGTQAGVDIQSLLNRM